MVFFTLKKYLSSKFPDTAFSARIFFSLLSLIYLSAISLIFTCATGLTRGPEAIIFKLSYTTSEIINALTLAG